MKNANVQKKISLWESRKPSFQSPYSNETSISKISPAKRSRASPSKESPAKRLKLETNITETFEEIILPAPKRKSSTRSLIIEEHIEQTLSPPKPAKKRSLASSTENLPPPKRHHQSPAGRVPLATIPPVSSPKRQVTLLSSPQKLPSKSPQSRFSSKKEKIPLPMDSPESPSKLPADVRPESESPIKLTPKSKPVENPMSPVDSLRVLSQQVDTFKFNQQLTVLISHLCTLIQSFPEPEVCSEADQKELNQIKEDLSRLQTKYATTQQEPSLKNSGFLQGKVENQISDMRDYHHALDLESKLNKKVASLNEELITCVLPELEDQEAHILVQELKNELNLSNLTISKQREEIAFLKHQLENQSQQASAFIMQKKETDGKENSPVCLINSPKKRPIKTKAVIRNSPLKSLREQGKTASLSSEAKKQFLRDVIGTNLNSPRKVSS